MDSTRSFAILVKKEIMTYIVNLRRSLTKKHSATDASSNIFKFDQMSSQDKPAKDQKQRPSITKGNLKKLIDKTL
jgi:hypothetical protein